MAVQAHVDVDEVVELTKALVSVDTRNPPGHERPIAGVVRDALAHWNPEWTEIEPASGRLSLIASLPHPDGPKDRPTLIINGHLDVAEFLLGRGAAPNLATTAGLTPLRMRPT